MMADRLGPLGSLAASAAAAAGAVMAAGGSGTVAGAAAAATSLCVLAARHRVGVSRAAAAARLVWRGGEGGRPAERPLGLLERWYHTSERTGVMLNFCLVVHGEADAPLREEDWRRAAARAAARLPALRVAVRERDGGAGPALVETDAPPEVRFEPRGDGDEDDEAWARVAERENVESTASWRLVVVHREGRAGPFEVLLTAHHGLVDGRAAAHAMGEVLRAYGEERAGAPPAARRELLADGARLAPRALDAMVDLRVRVSTVLRLLLENSSDESLGAGSGAWLGAAAKGGVASRTGHLVAGRLEPAVASALAARCRSEGFSVTQLVVAAARLAAAAAARFSPSPRGSVARGLGGLRRSPSAGGSDASLLSGDGGGGGGDEADEGAAADDAAAAVLVKADTAIDMRPLAGKAAAAPPPDDSLGTFVAAVDRTLPVRDTDSVWELARRSGAWRDPAALRDALELTGVLNLACGDDDAKWRKTVGGLADKRPCGRRSSVSISNLGVLRGLGTRHGNVTVRAVRHTQLKIAEGPVFNLCLATAAPQGVLAYTAAYVVPNVTHSQAAAFNARFQEELRAAADAIEQ